MIVLTLISSLCTASVWNSKETSWGAITASGILLNDRGLSVAMRDEPLGSWIKITNPKNGKSVAVQVIDRGPYVRGRCVDMSEGLAEFLGIKGLGKVKLERFYVASR